MSYATTTPTTPQTAVAVVRDFLEAMAAEDLDTTFGLLTEDISWHNTSLPTLRGRRVRDTIAGLSRPSVGFGVTIHHIAAEGNVVLTERTDVLRVGRVSISFWVCGTFHVRDGRIAVWDDHFDVGTFVRAAITGIARALVGRT